MFLIVKNIYMKKPTFLTFIIVLISLQSYAQDIKDFNMPPNTSFAPKLFQKIDYSYKLNDASINEPIERNYLLKFSEIQLEEIKSKDLVTYNYYNTANNYFKSLSESVKRKFTVKELWYVYIYDQKLKNKLLTVK
jgi:hypothetical protein